MRIAIQLALLFMSGGQFASGQHFRQVTLPTGPEPRWIAVADVNNDRCNDILVANAGSLLLPLPQRQCLLTRAAPCSSTR